MADSDFGAILTDADGMTIYFFANDTEGTSNCEDDCLANWPPVEAEENPTAGDGVTAELGTIERSDGTRQLTVNGFPAYYFAGDAAAGDVNGQGQWRRLVGLRGRRRAHRELTGIRSGPNLTSSPPGGAPTARR